MKIEVNINIYANDESNLYLRALWAEIRIKLGKCAWEFFPNVNRENKTVGFGRFSVNSEIKEPIDVYITYVNKGGIKTIVFLSQNSDISIIENIAKNVLNNFKRNLKTTFYSTLFDSIYPINEYKSEHLEISLNDSCINELFIKIRGYDDVDMKVECKKKIDKILDIISCTTCYYTKFYSNKKDPIIRLPEIKLINYDTNEVEESPKIKRCDYETHLNQYSEEIPFDINEDHLVSKGLVYLPHKVITILEQISCDEPLSDNIILLINAGRLYNSALSFETPMMRNVFRIQNMEIEEIIITKYMSVLEILSGTIMNFGKCESCGQNVYSISNRVKDFLKEVFGNNEYLIKKIHNYYSKRSMFLHTGKYFSTKSYMGVTIPLLDNTNELIEYQLSKESPDLKWCIGECFDFFIKNKIQHIHNKS